MIVIAASSPSYILARPLLLEAQYQAMLQDLGTSSFCSLSSIAEGTSSSCSPLSIDEGAAVSVWLQGRAWARAVVLEEVKDDKVRVFLCDLGEEAHLAVSTLRPLLPHHLLLPCLALALGVCGVRPAGGGAWTRTARERSQLLVEGREVEVEVLAAPEWRHESPACYPAKIFLLEDVTQGPMEPVSMVRRDLASMLQEEGLALPLRKSLRGGWKVAGWEDQDIPEQSVEDDNISIMKSEASLDDFKPNLVKTVPPPEPWLPAVLPQQTSFQCVCW